MVIGFARGNDMEQANALAAAGCEKIFETHKACFDFLQRGDTLVVWKLERLDYLLTRLTRALDDLQARGVRFLSLDGVIDTATAGGKTMLQTMMTFDELNRTILNERWQVAAALAKRRGVGKPAKILNHDDVARQAIELRAKGKMVLEIAHKFKISRATLTDWTNDYKMRQEKAERFKPLGGANAVAP